MRNTIIKQVEDLFKGLETSERLNLLRHYKERLAAEIDIMRILTGKELNKYIQLCNEVNEREDLLAAISEKIQSYEKELGNVNIGAD